MGHERCQPNRHTFRATNRGLPGSDAALSEGCWRAIGRSREPLAGLADGNAPHRTPSGEGVSAEMTASMSPKPVPVEKSLAKYVEGEWKRIGDLIRDGHPSSYAIRALQSTIDTRDQLINEGKFGNEFDWEADLKTAKFYNDFYVSWTPAFEKSRDRQLNYWESESKRTIEYAEKISLAGINTILLLHGAVAIGSLNVIAQKAGLAAATTVLAAKVGLAGSLIGIALLAVGQVLIFERVSTISQTIRGRLSLSPTQKKLSAMSRYWSKYVSIARKGDYLIYCSLFVFFLNCFIAYFILI